MLDCMLVHGELGVVKAPQKKRSKGVGKPEARCLDQNLEVQFHGFPSGLGEVPAEVLREEPHPAPWGCDAAGRSLDPRQQEAGAPSGVGGGRIPRILTAIGQRVFRL